MRQKLYRMARDLMCHDRVFSDTETANRIAWKIERYQLSCTLLPQSPGKFLPARWQRALGRHACVQFWRVPPNVSLVH